MAIGVASYAGGAAILAAILVAGAAARGSVAAPADAPSQLASPDWEQLTVRSIAQGSGTGAPAAPAQTVEPATADEAAEAQGPVRLTGLAGADLNAALAAAGVPAAIAQDYLRALAGKIALADGISVADRFDLVIDRQDGSESLLYAGLDRVGALDVQLMRWVHEGKAGWMDASGTAAGAEAMRMPVSGRVSSSFGMRFHPILQYKRFHRGVDLKAAAGAPIRAPSDGRVLSAGWSGGYGRQVRIAHGDGLTTSFSHMSRIAAAPGGRVRRGEVIGYVGSSGLSTGPHLHYEVLKNGRPVNPLAARMVGEASMDRDERMAFNARLRALLMASWSS
jgi:murein DD-endopeptidase MepM/ murein hydrolase activator NlpD